MLFIRPCKHFTRREIGAIGCQGQTAELEDASFRAGPGSLHPPEGSIPSARRLNVSRTTWSVLLYRHLVQLLGVVRFLGALFRE